MSHYLQDINMKDPTIFSKEMVDLIVNGFGNIVLSKKEQLRCSYCKSFTHNIKECKHSYTNFISDNLLDKLYRLMNEDREIILNTLTKRKLKLMCCVLFIPIDGVKKELIKRILLFMEWRTKVNELINNKLNKIKINIKSFSQREIPTLPTEPVSCPICLEDEPTLHLANYLETKCCGHFFCMNCVKSHLKKDEDRKCPMCRTMITELNSYKTPRQLAKYNETNINSEYLVIS